MTSAQAAPRFDWSTVFLLAAVVTFVVSLAVAGKS